MAQDWCSSNMMLRNPAVKGVESGGLVTSRERRDREVGRMQVMYLGCLFALGGYTSASYDFVHFPRRGKIARPQNALHNVAGTPQGVQKEHWKRGS